MEFGEKLQLLRKQHGLTQEQLAAKLYVSRTAVSKWESGKGYPGIDSLKAISGVFSVSIDDLLSGEELLTLAQRESSAKLKRFSLGAGGVLDLMAAALIFLPLYGEAADGYIYSVSLPRYTSTTPFNLAVFWVMAVVMTALGAVRLGLVRFEKERCASAAAKASMALSVICICFFIAAREPYAATFLFLLFVGKVFLLVKEGKTN